MLNPVRHQYHMQLFQHLFQLSNVVRTRWRSHDSERPILTSDVDKCSRSDKPRPAQWLQTETFTLKFWTELSRDWHTSDKRLVA
jgi:hypothetical protein